MLQKPMQGKIEWLRHFALWDISGNIVDKNSDPWKNWYQYALKDRNGLAAHDFC